MVKQCRAGEVSEWRLEVSACTNELRMCVEQRAEPVDVARLDRLDGVAEARMRCVRADAARGFDVVLERRPALEAVFAGDDELRVREGELGIEHRGRRLVLQSRVVSDDPRGGGLPAGTVELMELAGLALQLREARPRGQGPGRHMRSFRGEPDVRGA